MKRETISDALNYLDDDILQEAQSARQARSKPRVFPKRTWLALAACLAVVAVSGSYLAFWGKEPAVLPPVIEQVQPGGLPVGDAPYGMRKILNYNGCRYAFLEDGASWKISEDQLLEELGTLDYDIQQDPEQYSGMDGAASFAVGGTIYRMAGYDPEFRVAVKWQDSYYIGENVDTLDGSDVDVGEYFSLASFPDTVKEVLICDHAGNNVLKSVSGKEVDSLVEGLAYSAKPAALSNEEYEQIAKAQTNGQSYQLSFALTDGTRYRMYIIPSLSIAMMGDNRYKLEEDFVKEFSPLFDGLSQEALPAN